MHSDFSRRKDGLPNTPQLPGWRQAAHSGLRVSIKAGLRHWAPPNGPPLLRIFRQSPPGSDFFLLVARCLMICCSALTTRVGHVDRLMSDVPAASRPSIEAGLCRFNVLAALCFAFRLSLVHRSVVLSGQERCGPASATNVFSISFQQLCFSQGCLAYLC
jgi:hypothetical protein